MARTSLTKHEPFRELATACGEMERMVHQMFPRTLEQGDETSILGSWSPSLDVEETDDAYVVHVEIPGVEPDDIDISLDEDILTIDGERLFYQEKQTEGFRRIERRFGGFHRAIRLPTHVVADEVDANYHDGLLTISVPKAEEAKPRKIEVRAA